LIHRAGFVVFMQHVHDAKETPGHTNIEKNFSNALTDIPTLTELATLALYNVAISWPFMSYVRWHHNLLDLEPFFQRKKDLLASIIAAPTVWSKPGSPPQSVYLGEGNPEPRAIQGLAAVHNLAPRLPHLDDAIVAFVTRARETFVERFSEEFKEGGDISALTKAEREELFFPSMNDVNEGALGAWRQAQHRRVSETLHKFNSSKQASLNGTEEFITHVLTEDDDHLHLRRAARLRDQSGIPAQLKRAQIEADKKKAEKNQLARQAREEGRKKKEAAIMETSKNLVLDDAVIERLSVKELNRQLDFHRDAEKSLNLPQDIRVPGVSLMKSKPVRVSKLKMAVARYKVRLALEPESVAESGGPQLDDARYFDPQYEYDYYDDHF
jgi:hypothetical protein